MAQTAERLPAGVRKLRLAGRAAALLGFVIGVVEIIGLLGGIEAITEPVPGRPRISGTAAVAFTLAAAALLVDRPPPAPGRRVARDVLGAAVAALVMIALLDRALDLWPGVGMPSIPASFALIMVAAALVVIDRTTPTGRRPAEALGAGVGFIGLVTMMGHAVGATQVYVAPDHGTAPAGSICLCLLSASLLLARPAEGLVSLLWSPTAGGVTARRLGFATLVVIPGLGILVTIARFYFGFEDRTAFVLVIAGATTLGLAVVAFTSGDLDRSDREAARASAAEYELRALLEALTRASDAIAESVARMEGHDVVPVLREIAEQARLLVGAEYAAVGIPSDDDPATFAQLATAGGPAPEVPGKTQLSFAGSPVGTLLLGDRRDGSKLTVDDQQKIDLFAARAAGALRAARLREVEARGREWLQTVIDQMPEPILITDEDGEVQHWNRAAAEAHGDDETLGEHARTMVLDARLPSGAPVPREQMPYALALARGEAITGIELVLRTRAGASLPVMASAAPLHDLDGHVRGAVALFDDISTLKELERMREEWTAVIAHDLRQPLNGIVLHAQVLRRGLGPAATERQLESIEHIRVAGLRLNRMIEDLLDATRIEASRLKLERRPLALPPLVKEILARTPQLAGREVHIATEEELPEVFADAARIEQVVANLLTNAAKYGDGDSAIEVRIALEGAEVRVSVTNEGAEIEEAHLSRLFTRFYRTPSAEAGPKRGLGLGLYISKGLVEAHGGRIRAESGQRRTTFHFTLPPASPAT